MVRTYLSANSEEWFDIIENKKFRDTFTVLGTKLKNVPRGYEKENPAAEYLKYKSWFLEYTVEDEKILDAEGFVKTAGEKFALMVPFHTYLNRALKEFRMPERK